MVKRNVPLDATLDVDGMPAAQEVVVDPEVGLHVRPPALIAPIQRADRGTTKWVLAGGRWGASGDAPGAGAGPDSCARQADRPPPSREGVPMFTTLSAATRSTGLRAASALGLLVMVAALSSCADTTGAPSRTSSRSRTTQVELDADQSRQSEARDCNPGKREPARAGHGQRANDRWENHRGARKGHGDEADENENEWDETDEDENERDEDEADENEQDENED